MQSGSPDLNVFAFGRFLIMLLYGGVIRQSVNNFLKAVKANISISVRCQRELERRTNQKHKQLEHFQNTFSVVFTRYSGFVRSS